MVTPTGAIRAARPPCVRAIPWRTARRSAARRAPRAARRRRDASSSEPSSARAASPALLSISSAILASMVCAAMIRQAVTGSVWPMRWLRSIAWVCSASVQESSASTMLEATCRLRPDAGRGQRADRDGDVGVVHEGVDVLLPRRRRLVAADRGEADPALGEGLLGDVHHVDVLGEEDDLAGAAGELRRVVGGEAGLRLADAPHHAEHVLVGSSSWWRPCAPAWRSGARGRGRCPRRRGRTCGSRARSRTATPAGGRARARPPGSSGRPSRRARRGGRRCGGRGCRRPRRPCGDGRCRGRSRSCGRPGRTRGRPASGPVSSSASISSASGFLSSIQPRNCQMARKSSMSLISGVPVRAISSGAADAGPDALGELQHVLRALGGLVLDEVRLVDDHAAEARGRRASRRGGRAPRS